MRKNKNLINKIINTSTLINKIHLFIKNNKNK